MIHSFLLLIVIMLTFSHSVVQAATVVPSEDSAQTTVIDGVTVIYDNDAINGGLNIDKTPQTTVIDGVTVQFDDSVVNGGIALTAHEQVQSTAASENTIQHTQEEAATEMTNPSSFKNIQDYPSGHIVNWYEPVRLFPILLLLSIVGAIITVITLLIRKLIRWFKKRVK